jgi:broad specificity phosphatase PhoE
MKLLVARHGQSVANTQDICASPDSPLTDQGRTEAKLAAARLKGVSIDGIIASPMLRAQQTAQIIHELVAPGLVLETNVHFAEINVGDAVNRPVSEYLTKLKAAEPIAGAETPEAVLERVKQGLEILKTRDATLVLVTHDVVARMIIISLENLPASRLMEVPGLVNGEIKEFTL